MQSEPNEGMPGSWSVLFFLPYLLWDREEEKHHKLKACCQQVHRRRRGFQVGEVQEHKVSPRRLAQVWGKGGQTGLSQPECWFSTSETL